MDHDLLKFFLQEFEGIQVFDAFIKSKAAKVAFGEGFDARQRLLDSGPDFLGPANRAILVIESHGFPERATDFQVVSALGIIPNFANIVDIEAVIKLTVQHHGKDFVLFFLVRHNFMHEFGAVGDFQEVGKEVSVAMLFFANIGIAASEGVEFIKQHGCRDIILDPLGGSADDFCNVFGGIILQQALNVVGLLTAIPRLGANRVTKAQNQLHFCFGQIIRQIFNRNQAEHLMFGAVFSETSQATITFFCLFPLDENGDVQSPADQQAGSQVVFDFFPEQIVKICLGWINSGLDDLGAQAEVFWIVFQIVHMLQAANEFDASGGKVNGVLDTIGFPNAKPFLFSGIVLGENRRFDGGFTFHFHSPQWNSSANSSANSSLPRFVILWFLEPIVNPSFRNFSKALRSSTVSVARDRRAGIELSFRKSSLRKGLSKDQIRSHSTRCCFLTGGRGGKVLDGIRSPFRFRRLLRFCGWLRRRADRDTRGHWEKRSLSAVGAHLGF